MITPLGQRQVFQTANVEALRQALETSEQVQREAARMKATDDRMTEDAAAVHQIAHAEALRTEERQERRRRQQEQGREAQEQTETEPEGAKAGSAEPHLDFLV